MKLLAVILFASVAIADEQRFAPIGDLTLESGEVIRNCRIGYRVAGTLSEDRSNIVVLTTWFSGTSGALASAWAGEGKLFDTSRYYVITIDALGNGVSSSPSNTAQRPFPRLTIRDMVRSQHALLTKALGIDRVFLVAGLSMGGMQTLEWAVAYPEFMQNAIAITPTPKLTSYDIAFWRVQLDLLESFSSSCEDMKKAMNAIAGMNALALRTPAWTARNVKSAGEMLDTHRKSIARIDPFDYMSHLRAIMSQDIYRHFDGSAVAAAKAIRARLLIVIAEQDGTVNPEPAREFARLAGAKLVTLRGDCGHVAPGCEGDVLSNEVRRFLGTPRASTPAPYGSATRTPR